MSPRSQAPGWERSPGSSSFQYSRSWSFAAGVPKRELGNQKINAIEDYQQHPVTYVDIATLEPTAKVELTAPMVTLCIDGGRKSKIRPGDILGSLTGAAGIEGKYVGKIDITDNHSYVAIEQNMANQAVRQLAEGTIKGRKLRVWKVR